MSQKKHTLRAIHFNFFSTLELHKQNAQLTPKKIRDLCLTLPQGLSIHQKNMEEQAGNNNKNQKTNSAVLCGCNVLNFAISVVYRQVTRVIHKCVGVAPTTQNPITISICIGSSSVPLHIIACNKQPPCIWHRNGLESARGAQHTVCRLGILTPCTSDLPGKAGTTKSW